MLTTDSGKGSSMRAAVATKLESNRIGEKRTDECMPSATDWYTLLPNFDNHVNCPRKHRFIISTLVLCVSWIARTKGEFVLTSNSRSAKLLQNPFIFHWIAIVVDVLVDGKDLLVSEENSVVTAEKRCGAIVWSFIE